MNGQLFEAARRAGCTRAEAELIAWYVEVDSMKAAAHRVGISEGTARNHITRLKRRLDVPHLGAAIAKLALTHLVTSAGGEPH